MAVFPARVPSGELGSNNPKGLNHSPLVLLKTTSHISKYPTPTPGFSEGWLCLWPRCLSRAEVAPQTRPLQAGWTWTPRSHRYPYSLSSMLLHPKSATLLRDCPSDSQYCPCCSCSASSLRAVRILTKSNLVHSSASLTSPGLCNLTGPSSPISSCLLVSFPDKICIFQTHSVTEQQHWDHLRA